MGSRAGFVQLAPEKLVVHGGRLSVLCSGKLGGTTPGPEGTKNFPYTWSRRENEQVGTEHQRCSRKIN